MTMHYLRSAIFLAITTLTCVSPNALEDYVNTPDPHYTYQYVKSYSAPGVTVHALNLTSQKWLSDDVSSSPFWYHDLFIVVPVQISHPDTASIYIGIGSNTDALADLSDSEVKLAVTIATITGAVAAVIKQVPNQPIVFQDDPNHIHKVEDGINAWTWKKFFENTSDPNILLLLPMTKAVVKGMDAISSYVNGLNGNVIDKFLVAGKSKRGWTTWLTAGVDKRVIAIAPTVFDLLNMKQNLLHHYRSLGGWSYALNDYFQVNFTYKINEPAFLQLQDILDGLAYNDRYNIPKLIITSSGDEFFLLDDSHYFYDQLQSPKYLRIYPNASHVTTPEISYAHDLSYFFLNVLEKAQLPEVTWVLSQTGYGGKISAKTSKTPNSVTAYYAVTADDKRRDFRFIVLDPVSHTLKPNHTTWHRTNVTTISDLEYEVDVTRTPTGWLAVFIEFIFSGVNNSTLVFTTQANIIPDIFAFPECTANSCPGTLL